MKELELRNRQRVQRLNLDELRRITRSLLEVELGLGSYELAVHFVSATRIADMNQRFLQHSGSTDVITFDYREGYEPTAFHETDLAGEIYISVPDARSQAKEFSTTWQEEIIRYVVHGVLHLRGYDDIDPAQRKRMKGEENRIVRRLSQSFDSSRIGR